jgi:hypothetical protein
MAVLQVLYTRSRPLSHRSRRFPSLLLFPLLRWTAPLSLRPPQPDEVQVKAYT